MTASGTPVPQLGAHLVGSVPLESADAVFRAVADRLGSRVTRIPDGETGDRAGWIGIQLPMLTAHPQLEYTGSRILQEGVASMPAFRLRPGTDPGALVIPSPGYADFAVASYPAFAALKKDGVIGPAARFQVSLPTPLAVPMVFLPDDQLAVEPAFLAATLAEIDGICAEIPHDELAIQWDVSPEFIVLEGAWRTQLADVPCGIASRLAELGNYVPAEVALGYHLCYGDLGHKHAVEPRDTANLVDIANRVAAALTRPLNWVHMPVPRDRDDPGYFEPLQDLRLPDGDLYLGLVHATDGAAGARRRIAAAAHFRDAFGVGTECGMGRRPPAGIPALLDLHRVVIDGSLPSRRQERPATPARPKTLRPPL
ncbi:MAG: hypothetical protein ACRDOI_12015 [Trebonia sp.]